MRFFTLHMLSTNDVKKIFVIKPQRYCTFEQCVNCKKHCVFVEKIPPHSSSIHVTEIANCLISSHITCQKGFEASWKQKLGRVLHTTFGKPPHKICFNYGDYNVVGHADYIKRNVIYELKTTGSTKNQLKLQHIRQVIYYKAFYNCKVAILVYLNIHDGSSTWFKIATHKNNREVIASFYKRLEKFIALKENKTDLIYDVLKSEKIICKTFKLRENCNTKTECDYLISSYTS